MEECASRPRDGPGGRGRHRVGETGGQHPPPPGRRLLHPPGAQAGTHHRGRLGGTVASRTHPEESKTHVCFVVFIFMRNAFA